MEDADVVAIYIGPTVGGPMESVEEARAVPGLGLVGDRYYLRSQAGWANAGPDREVTLIEEEAIEALRKDHNLVFGLDESRRNIVTRGASLNDLVGREFRVGQVTLRGIRPCDPCLHLEKLTRAGVMKGLASRGGLRAQILSEGVVRVGDAVEI